MKGFYLRGKFDFPLFFSVVALWVFGNMLVYSATLNSTLLSGTSKMQILWSVMGGLIILLAVSIPTRVYYALSPFVYGITVMLLLVVLVGGESAKGAGRWIGVGSIRVQPSEFAKIGLLMMLARYLSKKDISLYNLRSLVIPSLIILLPFALIIKQPDLGTALVFMAMSLPMFFWAGMSLIEIFYLISPGISVVLSAIPLILSFGAESQLGISGSIPWALFFVALMIILRFFKPPFYILIAVLSLNITSATMTTVLWNSSLKDYQKMRIISFVNPQADPRGAGYQVIQSMIALGSGQATGKGYLEGSQVNLSYLPEQHTDFIFSVLGEQFGFMGCVAVLLLFLFIIIRALASTQQLRNRFANLLLVGASAIIAFHIFVNIAMVVGMMPVTGLPLPILSYGGSFTLTISILIGLILNTKADLGNR
jgi:rod shape determining protein RodA